MDEPSSSAPLNRDAIFAAADYCRANDRPIDATTRLLTKEEAESAFAAWENERGQTGVTMELVKNEHGELVAHFEPPLLIGAP
jgi:hypothetical protein